MQQQGYQQQQGQGPQQPGFQQQQGQQQPMQRCEGKPELNQPVFGAYQQPGFAEP